MAYEIAKTFAFDAAHRLDHLPSDHKCHRLHGHTYRVELRFRAQSLDARSFVIDYGDLRTFKAWVDDNLDHRFLNEVMPLEYGPTTAENIAAWLFTVARALYSTEWPRVTLHAVRVSETPNTWAEYSPFSLT